MSESNTAERIDSPWRARWPESGSFAEVDRAASYPRAPAHVPADVTLARKYELRFARNERDLRAVQRLRFRVFNLELNEGLESSYENGLDEDEFDARCHHLMVCDRSSGEVVGTYRAMTAELASRDLFYSTGEFDLSTLPNEVVRLGVEVGRACVAREHRNGRVLQLLWRGITAYMKWNEKRYLFGCCSVPTLERASIAAVSLKLLQEGRFHKRLHTAVMPAYRADDADEIDVALASEPALPPLFASYLRLGARVCGGPAIDRAFGVTDYFVLLDLRDVDARVLSSLGAGTSGSA